VFLVVSVLIGMCLYAMVVIAFINGNPWVAAGAIWLASPIPMLILAVLEPARGKTVLARLQDAADIHHGSLAFLLGDVVFLPIMAAVIAVGWRKVNLNGWAVSGWWILSALAFGVIAGLVFHHFESAVFSDAALNSPTKLWHDLVTYPVLFGGLTFGFVPMFAQASPARWIVASAMLVLWVLAGVSDGTWHKLVPTNLHKPYIWSQG
jgi:hypothetical protein